MAVECDMASREIRLVKRPAGMPAAADFELATVPLPELEPGAVQVRNLWMSVDPYMRGRMRDVASYVPPFRLGEVLQGGAVGVVVKSNAASLKEGDTVVSMFGWREAFNAPADAPGMMKVDTTKLAPEMYLGVAGLTGLTAYVGMLDVAKVREGDVVFISAAAGAVGSVACQIAKLQGATVIGSAGGAEKGEFVRSLGVDAVIDYKAEKDLTAALGRVAPEGISVYFDNVGGAHLEAALAVAKPYARFAMCGMIEGYNDGGAPVQGLANIVKKRLRLEGFIVSDHFDQVPRFLGQMVPWIASGKVRSAQTVDEGIEQAVGAFLKLFQGGNVGKMLVKL